MNQKKNTSPTNGSTSTKSQRTPVLEPVNCPSVGAKTNGSSGCASALDEDAAPARPAGPAGPAGRSSRAAMVASVASCEIFDGIFDGHNHHLTDTGSLADIW